MSYLESQVKTGLADWVDACNPGKGIIAREMLQFGARPLPELPLTAPQYCLGELPGLKFIPPKTDTRPSIAFVREAWDWSAEAAV